MEKNSIYSAKIFIKNQWKSKTFFPQQWTRDEVVGKIMEAYTNFIKNNPNIEIKKDNKYEILATTNEGIKIKIYFKKNAYEMIVAYPIF